MVPITRRASSLKKYAIFLLIIKPILISSMLAAGIVQDRFVGEAGEGEGGEEETTGGYFYCYFYRYFYRQARKSSVPTLEFNSQNTQRTHAY